MATYYFLGTENTDWDEGGNWYDAPSGGNNNYNPTSSDDVVILAEVNTVGVPPTVNSVLIDSGGVTKIDFTATNGCTVTNGGRLAQGTIFANVLCTGSPGGAIGWASAQEGAPYIAGNLTFSTRGYTDADVDNTIFVGEDLIFQSDCEITQPISWINVSNNVYYYYGATGSFSNLNIAGDILYVDYPTLYYVGNPSTDNDWANIDNWWVDIEATKRPSTFPPDSSQDAVIVGCSIGSNSGASAIANNVSFTGATEMHTIYLSIDIAANSITFSDWTYYGNGTASVTLTCPSVVMNDNSYLNTNSSVVGDVNFYGTSSHYGSITGNVTVYSPHAVPFNSSNGNNGNISGTIYYNGYPARTVYFYHTSSSEEWTNLNYWWDDSNHTIQASYIPDGVISKDNVIIQASVYDSGTTSITVGSLTVEQNPMLNYGPIIFDSLSINCDYANFNDYSVNQGTIVQSQYHGTNTINFNDFSSNDSTGIVNPYTTDNLPVKFQDSSFNDGTVNGDAEVYFPSEKPIGGTVTGTVTYFGYPNSNFSTIYFGGYKYL